MRALLRCSAALVLALAAGVAQAQVQVFSAERGIYARQEGYAAPTVLVASSACPDPLSMVTSNTAAINAACVTATEYERRRITATENGCYSAFGGTRDPNDEDLSSVVADVTYRSCPACTSKSCNAACYPAGGGYGSTNVCTGGLISRPVCNISVKTSTRCREQWLSPSDRGGFSCGVIRAVWDVPAGAAVFYEFSSDDPIQQVIQGLEEQYAHVVLSLGDQGIAHATGQMANHRKVDSIIDMSKACDYPLFENDLRYMAPGVEIVNFGAMLVSNLRYRLDEEGNYVLDENNVPVTAGKWRESSFGTQIARWVLDEADKITVTSSAGYPGATYKRLRRNGSVIPYGLYQYTNIETTHLGANSSAAYNGMVCSTFMAWAHANAGAGVIDPYTYEHDELRNQLNEIHNEIQTQCVARMHEYGTSANWVDDRCFLADRGVCTAAANQITNCFVTPTGCGLNSPYWKNTRDDPNARPTSISPDRIGGYGRHAGVNSTWAGPGSGPELTPMWSAAGATYGCWR
jgi:hypothetical protein